MASTTTSLKEAGAIVEMHAEAAAGQAVDLHDFVLQRGEVGGRAFGFLQSVEQVFAVGDARQEFVSGARREIQPLREAGRLRCVGAELSRAGVEQVLAAGIAVGDAASEIAGDADETEIDVGVVRSGEGGGERCAAESGADDGDAHPGFLRWGTEAVCGAVWRRCVKIRFSSKTP